MHKKVNIVPTDSLEIFKQNVYNPTDIGLVSNNAYLSIVVTNDCQYSCAYCINSETDRTKQLPIKKAVRTITGLVEKYGVKEAILLGGEPTLHPEIFALISMLRRESGWSFCELLRMVSTSRELMPRSSSGIWLTPANGVQGVNISWHNDDFIRIYQLEQAYRWIKDFNPDCKVRINANIWRGNLDTLPKIIDHIDLLRGFECFDEIRISNIIPKDSFSVNPKNSAESLVLPDEEYNRLFAELIEYYTVKYGICAFENQNTLGFVRYVLIPTRQPIIVNWNIGSTVSEQVCENNIKERKINTFKCLVSGDISLSWNEGNVI